MWLADALQNSLSGGGGRSGTVRAAWWRRMRLSAGMRADFYKTLARYFRARKSLFKVLSAMRDAIAEEDKHDVRVRFCSDLIEAIAMGTEISKACAPWLPNDEAMVLRAAQRSESVQISEAYARSFDEAAKLAEQKKDLFAFVLSRSGYPIFLTFLMLGVFSIISFNLMPQIAEVQDPSTLVGATRVMYELSDFYRVHWITCLLGLGAVVALIAFSIPNYVGAGRSTLDLVPPWSVYRGFTGATFLVAISSMVAANETVVKSVKAARDGAAPYLAAQIDLIQMRLGQGWDPLSSFSTSFLETESRIALKVASADDEFDEILADLAEKQMVGVKRRIGRVMGLVTVLLMLLVVVFILFSYSSIYGVSDTSTL